MEVNDIHVGKQLQVSSGVGAGVVGPAVSPSPPALCFGIGPTAISGTAWIENGLLVGSPITYPSPALEAQVMIGRAPIQNARATAISILKVSSRGSVTPTGTPIDVMFGDPSGPVGVMIYGGPTNPVTVLAKDLLFTAVTAELHATLKKSNLTASKDDINAVSSDIGTKAFAGVEGHTGAVTDVTAAFTMGPILDVAIPSTGAADYSSVGGSLNGTTATAFSALAIANAKKPFDIPHPTKKGWRLRYVCLEGPTADVYVRGKLKDKNIIELPDYWRGLVDAETITVNLTPIGIYQELYYEQVEWGTKIKVINSSGGPIHCSYTVYGERKDTNKNIAEYEGLTPADYPGDNKEYKF